MKKIEIPEELLRSILCWNHYAWTDDFAGWDGDQKALNEVEGFRREGVMEGHKMIAESGEEYCPQYAYLRKGNHLSTRMMKKVKDEWVEEATIALAELPLFRDHEVVIQTSNEHIHAIAPVFDNKDDVVTFISLLNDFYFDLKEAGLEPEPQKKTYMERLTLYLYRNNPKKQVLQSIFDQIA